MRAARKSELHNTFYNHEYHGDWHSGQVDLVEVLNHLDRQAEWNLFRQVWQAMRGSELLTRCSTV